MKIKTYENQRLSAFSPLLSAPNIKSTKQTPLHAQTKREFDFTKPIKEANFRRARPTDDSDS